MCGEVFSTKYTPEQKSSPSLAKPHPLARPGLWSVVYEDGSRLERAWFDGLGDRRAGGYATKAEAEAALKENQPFDERDPFKVIPPAETFGDHDPSLLSRDQLERLARAILNNDQASFEAMRPELAAASSPRPRRTRAEVADAIVAFLTDQSGDAGNDGDYLVRKGECEDCDATLEIIDDNYLRLQDLVAEYDAAPIDVAPSDDAARAVVKFLRGEDCDPGDWGAGANNCIHPDDGEDVRYSFNAEDSAELRRLVLAAS